MINIFFRIYSNTTKNKHFTLFHADIFFIKKSLIIFFLLLISNVYPQKTPFFIQTEDKITKKIIKVIERNIPEGRTILFLDTNYLNFSKPENTNIIDNLKKHLSSNKNKITYIIKSSNDLQENDSSLQDLFNTLNEQSAVHLFKKLKINSVLNTNMTKVSQKKVWNIETGKWVDKDVIRIQGTLFNTEDSKVQTRFSFYFLPIESRL